MVIVIAVAMCLSGIRLDDGDRQASQSDTPTAIGVLGSAAQSGQAINTRAVKNYPASCVVSAFRTWLPVATLALTTPCPSGSSGTAVGISPLAPRPPPFIS